MDARRDTLTSVDTAVSAIGLLGYGLATKNRVVSAVAALTGLALVVLVALRLWVVALIVAGSGYGVQWALALRRPMPSGFNNMAAILLGGLSVFHYVTVINLRYEPAKLMGLLRTVIRCVDAAVPAAGAGAVVACRCLPARSPGPQDPSRV